MTSINTTCSNSGVSTGIAQLLLSQLVSTLVRSYCDLYPPYPRDQSAEIFAHDHRFDFIVVGAGSAGSAIANRLTETSGWRVLLVEAGPDPPMETNIPYLSPTLLGSAYDWRYETEGGEKACRAFTGRRCAWPRGKMLGGSSSMNFMYYVRGDARDYDRWQRLGNAGWGYERVLPYFKKLETVAVPYANEATHGRRGYVHVQEFANATKLRAERARESLRRAFAELGYPYVREMATEMRSALTDSWGTVEEGVRDNAARAYLAPIRDRPNLALAKETRVIGMLVDGARRVLGVEVEWRGRRKNVFCTKEVVVSAGTIGSAQLLMLSGVGPREHLRALNISVVEDLQVGDNLQDHVLVTGIFAALNETRESMAGADLMYEYLRRRTELGSAPASTLAFVDTVNGGGGIDDHPDVQFAFTAISPSNPYADLFGFDEESRRWMRELNDERYLLSMVPILLRPRSRGRIRLRSADASDPPKIANGYLEHDDDVRTLVRGIKFVEKLAQTAAFANTTLSFMPLKECARLPAKSDEYYECFVRNLGATAYHPVGSCKMGPAGDSSAVVDSRLKVRGVRGLRVADASVMPRVTSGNTNVPTIMIGEKAADLIKEDWLKINPEELHKKSPKISRN